MRYILPLGMLTLLFACQPINTQVVHNYPEADSEGAKVLLERCSSCHAAPLPSTHSAKVWPSVLNRMQDRMVTKSYNRLTPIEQRLLLDYLQKHANAVETL